MNEQAHNLDIETQREAETAIFRLVGDLDLQTSPKLRDTLLTLLTERPQKVILDLAGVKYVDSSGVGTIVELKRRAGKSDTAVVLVGLQARVRSLFEITKLDKFFTIVGSVDEARQI